MKKSASKIRKRKSDESHENGSGQILRKYKKWLVPGLTVLVVLILILFSSLNRQSPPEEVIGNGEEEVVSILLASDISLPQPDFRSNNSIEAVLRSRRTKRDFIDRNLTLKQISQILWSAQGVTVDWGGRTAPSSKSTFPLTVYVVASKVDDLEFGQYQYIPGDISPEHKLRPIKKVDLQEAMFESTNLNSFRNAPAILVVTGTMGKMAEAYGGIPHDKEVFLEAGAISQNIALQAESLKLGTVAVTVFDDSRIRELITIPDSDTIIYLMPIGNPAP